jgi:hypothetical protein
MKQSRVKRLADFFSSFFRPTLCLFLAKSCVLAGPAAEREWAIQKLVAVWPPQPDSTQRTIAAGFISGRLPTLLFVLIPSQVEGRHIKLHTAESSYSLRRGTKRPTFRVTRILSLIPPPEKTLSRLSQLFNFAVIQTADKILIEHRTRQKHRSHYAQQFPRHRHYRYLFA